jgi:hypothetical protein
MENFKSYLLSMRITDQKGVDFYLFWVKECYRYCRKGFKQELTRAEVEKFLRHLSKHREEWQVDQALEAIKLYRFHEKRKKNSQNRKHLKTDLQWKAVVGDMRKMLRLRHRSLRTEKTYMGWIRRFYRFLGGRSPYAIESAHVKDFMTIWRLKER